MRMRGISPIIVTIILIIIAVAAGVILFKYVMHSVSSAPTMPISVYASGTMYNDTFAVVTITVVNGPRHGLVIENISVVGARVVKIISGSGSGLPIVVPPTASRVSFVIEVSGKAVAAGSLQILLKVYDSDEKATSVYSVAAQLKPLAPP